MGAGFIGLAIAVLASPVPFSFDLAITSALIFAIIEAPPGDYLESYIAELRAQGEAVDTLSVESLRKETQPPRRFTDASLLAAMETAGKDVEDPELREAMKDSGIGTPATRAAIIERLIDVGYLERDGRALHATDKGIRVIELLGEHPLTSPELTGEWEFKLNRIEKGKLTREEFMRETEGLTRRIVKRIKGYNEDDDRKEAGFVNPVDGKPMTETTSRWQSADGKITIRKVMGGRQLSAEEVEELLRNRRIGPLTGFRSKAGKPFTAVLRLTDADKVEFVFEGGDGEAPEIVNPEPLGNSPVDGVPVFIREATPRELPGPSGTYRRERIFQQVRGDGFDWRREDGRLVTEIDHRHILEEAGS
jgi:DNA topoisomerase III